MLIHSCIYYELNESIISDHQWQAWADELQKLQEDYRQVGTLFDDSPYNVQGAQMQGIDTVHLRKNDEYWDAHPEQVFPYGL